MVRSKSSLLNGDWTELFVSWRDSVDFDLGIPMPKPFDKAFGSDAGISLSYKIG